MALGKGVKRAIAHGLVNNEEIFITTNVWVSEIGIPGLFPTLRFDIINLMREHEIRSEAVYLSLGDREEKTRNPVMATVGDNIREACRLLRSRNVSCTLEWNEGNHFRDAELRTAKAFAWILKQA